MYEQRSKRLMIASSLSQVTRYVMSNVNVNETKCQRNSKVWLHKVVCKDEQRTCYGGFFGKERSTTGWQDETAERDNETRRIDVWCNAMQQDGAAVSTRHTV